MAIHNHRQLRVLLGLLSVLLLLANFSSVCIAQSMQLDELAERKAAAEKYFAKQVTPFIKTYCLECHQNRRPTEAGLSFTPALQTPGHAAFGEKWKKSVARVKAHDMPPEDMEQPTDEERKKFEGWLNQVKYLSPKDPGPFVIRRLTRAEYGNTLRDLFGVAPTVVDSLPDDVAGEGYLNSISPLQMEQYLVIANKVLQEVIPDEATLDESLRALGVETIDAKEPGFVTTVAKAIASRAYRRPATVEETQVLENVFKLGLEQSLTAKESLRLMAKAVLVSPQFLFITPADSAAGRRGIRKVDDYQLASRLSYLLWATMPDDELLSLAAEGRLSEPAILKSQVQRMLKDPQATALFDGFAKQWLGLNDLQTRTFDADLFPELDAELRQAMLEEVRCFFTHVLRENLSIRRFVDSEYTFVNSRLAELYGLEAELTGDDMQVVELLDENRGGLLGMPAILAATSPPNRTSPVNRGVWVLERVLGEQVPAAPPNVPELDKAEDVSLEGLTLRERTERHRSDAVCANCHRLLDPIGFGLENFDAIGRWREHDASGKPVDASGELPDGQSFTSPSELKKIVSGRLHDFSRNLVERLMAYALCRRLEGYDQIVIDQLMTEIKESGYRMQEIVIAVVTSYPFTHQRYD